MNLNNPCFFLRAEFCFITNGYKGQGARRLPRKVSQNFDLSGQHRSISMHDVILHIRTVSVEQKLYLFQFLLLYHKFFYFNISKTIPNLSYQSFIKVSIVHFVPPYLTTENVILNSDNETCKVLKREPNSFSLS